MPEAAAKAVSRRLKLLFDQSRKACRGPIVRIDEQLRQRTDLRGTVPAVAAIDRGQNMVGERVML